MARRHLSRERRCQTLQATALVNEACLRLVSARTVTRGWQMARAWLTREMART